MSRQHFLVTNDDLRLVDFSTDALALNGFGIVQIKRCAGFSVATSVVDDGFTEWMV